MEAIRNLTSTATSAASSTVRASTQSEHAQLMESRRRSRTPEPTKSGGLRERRGSESSGTLDRQGSILTVVTNEDDASPAFRQESISRELLTSLTETVQSKVVMDPRMFLDLQAVLAQLAVLQQKMDCVSDQVSMCLDDTASLRQLCERKGEGPGSGMGNQRPSLQPPRLSQGSGSQCGASTASCATPPAGHAPRRKSSLGFPSLESVLSKDSKGRRPEKIVKFPELNWSEGTKSPTVSSAELSAGLEAITEASAGEASPSVAGAGGPLPTLLQEDGSIEVGAGEAPLKADDESSDDSNISFFNAGRSFAEEAAGAQGPTEPIVPPRATSTFAPPPPPPMLEDKPQEAAAEDAAEDASRKQKATAPFWSSEGSPERRRTSSGKRGFSLEYLDHMNSELHAEVSKALRRVRKRSAWAVSTWAFLEDPDTISGGRFFMNFISGLIVFSAAVPVVQTIEPQPFPSGVSNLELALDMVFAFEVLVRFYTCPNRIAFIVEPFNIVDIASGTLVLALRSVSTASVVQAEGNSYLLSLMCAVPVLRLLKLLRRFETFHLILRAFRLASEALPVLLYILTLIVLVFASLIYVVEPRHNIDSLPKALWLTVVTVGTVGYGDVVAQSPAGNLVTSAMIVVSALYMSIPVGIVGKAFSTVWDDRHRLLMLHRARTRFLERGYKPQDIPAMFCSFDRNGDGELDLPEFMAMMHKMQVALGTDRILELFLSFDADGSGAIDDAEFVRMLFPKAYAQMYGLDRLLIEDAEKATKEAKAVASSEVKTAARSKDA